MVWFAWSPRAHGLFAASHQEAIVFIYLFILCFVELFYCLAYMRFLHLIRSSLVFVFQDRTSVKIILGIWKVSINNS